MDITIDAQEPKDDKLSLTLTISANEVDKAVKAAYRAISSRYSFPGFRKGRTPRPVIDAQIGREAVLADATNDLLNSVEPQVVTQLDVVPVGRIEYAEDVQPVVEHESYEIDATFELTPTSALTSYEPVAIDLPPEEATDAEIESQIHLMLSYQAHFHEVEEDRPVKEGDFASVALENVVNSERYNDENRLIRVGGGLYPQEVEDALIGMKVGETKEVTYTPFANDLVSEDENASEDEIDEDEAQEESPATEELEADSSHGSESAILKVTINAIREQHIPELTDELAHDTFGFDSVDELRKGIAKEIESDKKNRLPQLKEERVLEALTKRLERTEFPETYKDQVYKELLSQIVDDLQAQGISLSVFLQSRGISPQQFIADIRDQAQDHAKQSVALDALAAERGIEAKDEDLTEEMEKAGVADINGLKKSLEAEGRLPELRRSIRRSRALDWLKETAQVSIVDEVAQEDEATAEEMEDVGAAVSQVVDEAIDEVRDETIDVHEAQVESGGETSDAIDA